MIIFKWNYHKQKLTIVKNRFEIIVLRALSLKLGCFYVLIKIIVISKRLYLDKEKEV